MNMFEALPGIKLEISHTPSAQSTSSNPKDWVSHHLKKLKFREV